MDIQKKLNYTGFTLLVIFFVSVFIGKGPINITNFLLLILSALYILYYQRDIFRKHNYLVIMLTPILAGIILSFFSELGIKAPFYFINRFKFILLLLPLTLFVDSKKKFMILYTAICISAVIAICYGLFDPDQHFNRIRGFHKIGRTAEMMMLLSISLMTLIIFRMENFNYKMKILLSFLFFACFFVLLSSARRGSWLGFLFGFFVLIIFKPKKTIPILMIGILLLFLSSNKKIYENKFLSIFDLNNNESNNARIHLFKTGTDFTKKYFWFGTGAENSKELFLKFFASKNESYQQKYNLAKEYPKDFHNSYLQIQIENGIIFFLLFVFSQFYILFKMIRFYYEKKNDENSYLLAIPITTSISFLFAVIFHAELYSYSSSIYYFFLFGGFYAFDDLFNKKTFIANIRFSKDNKKKV